MGQYTSFHKQSSVLGRTLRTVRGLKKDNVMSNMYRSSLREFFGLETMGYEYSVG